MNNNIVNARKEIKDNIEDLINNNYIEDAKELIYEYEKIDNRDIDIINMKGIIYIMEGFYDKALDLLIQVYSMNPDNFDIIYNLAYAYEMNGDINNSFIMYNEAAEKCFDDNQKSEVLEIIKRIKEKNPNIVNKKRNKIVFFHKSGMDSFLGDIIKNLSLTYEVKKVEVTNYNQIDAEMKWADICWFEWCDELIAYGSKHRLANTKKIICRLHRYEALTDYPKQVNWFNVDRLIIVTDHLKMLLSAQIPDIENQTRIVTVNNGVNVDRYKFKRRNPGYNLAYVGYLHARKNPVLLLQIMSKLVSINSKYKLFIAGVFQDSLQEMYFNYQIKAMNLEKNIVFEGWQKDIPKWLEDKNYIISTSIHESFGYGIAEAMCRGIKPIIHRFLYSEEIWDENYIFNTINEAIDMISSEDYSSEEYRDFIKSKYSLESQMEKTLELIEGLSYLSKKTGEAKKRIILVQRSNSGSNTYSIYKHMPEYIKESYDVKLVRENNSEEYIKLLLNSDVVVCTHGNYIIRKEYKNPKTKVVDLWHGLPTKTIGYADKNEKDYSGIEECWSKVDYISSNSDLYNEVMNKCIGNRDDKYFISGFPRNDLLIKSDGRRNLEKLIGRNVNSIKVFMYMPTYRQSINRKTVDGKAKNTNIFGFEEFDLIEFNKYLSDNNYIFLYKLHPNEEYFMGNSENLSNMIRITDNMLNLSGIDLYEIINSVDLLITDYSSVYIDFLLLDRPIVFLFNDFEEYRNKRGLMLEPFEEWTPGPKISDYEGMVKEIELCLEDKNYYKVERKNIRDKIHKYIDGKSSQRVWKFIDKII